MISTMCQLLTMHSHPMTFHIPLLQVLDTPHLTDCCGQHYCASCLSTWLTSCKSHTCPFCRNKAFNHIHDKHLDRRINELLVCCSNKSHGCGWTGCVINLKRHLDSKSTKPCPYLLVSCPLQCGDLYELKDIEQHIASDCTHREVPCEHCGVTSALYLMEHHHSECKCLPVLCRNNCGEMVKRNYLEDHENKECMNRSSVCPFHDVGCNALVRREDYEVHVKKCKEVHMVKAHEKVLSQIQCLKDEVLKSKEENQFLHSKIASLRVGLATCHENADILRQESIQLKHVLLTEMSYLHATASPCELVAVDCVKTHLRGLTVDLVPGGEAATFRITNYSARKANNEVWYSPTFHISHGYKFCLAIHLNGAGAGLGTHVALYLHQVTGQSDSGLTWPILLEEDLEVCLMSQDPPKEGKKPFFKGVTKSPTSSRRGRPNSYLSLDASPTLSLYTANIPTISSTSADGARNVIERQILSISQVLNQPDEHTHSLPVTKLELFCLQKTFEAANFLDSVVIQCKLIVSQFRPAE